ncbi:hypothetical protein Mapa_006252 [Marchantia paleacea]|nr:hypothetical protein Mapa_006252 [Marchantia paleacea]
MLENIARASGLSSTASTSEATHESTVFRCKLFGTRTGTTRTSGNTEARACKPSSFVRALCPTKSIPPAKSTSPPSILAGAWACEVCRPRRSRACLTSSSSPCLDGAPGRVIRACEPSTTAVSSTKGQSGNASSAGSSITRSPRSLSTFTYARCCCFASFTSIGSEGFSMASASAKVAGTLRTIAALGIDIDIACCCCCSLRHVLSFLREQEEENLAVVLARIETCCRIWDALLDLNAARTR